MSLLQNITKERTTRVLIHEKSSLAPPGETMAFKLGDEEGFRWVAESSKQIQIFVEILSATCRLPVHEYFQVSGVSKSRLTDNIEKRIMIIRSGISHTNACVGGVVYGGIAELEKLVQTGRKKFVKYCKNRQTVVRS